VTSETENLFPFSALMMSSREPQQPCNWLLISIKLSRQFNLRWLRSNLIRNPTEKFDF